ncbi:hypothetical protein AMTR_s00049p00062540 [Amborella trichopoda]|uniref:Uncharacterized protein n=1 Tax=Amborella trichopoda TaxID=13333 RepID=W1PZ17_AMBTC|nr:hypothetical protein AMTR_s00049p00062540 [Amborella trichopoda]
MEFGGGYMLGMRRPAPSSELLHRPHSKIPKQDSLSIYEATLEKLRAGSRIAWARPQPMEGVKKETTNNSLDE